MLEYKPIDRKRYKNPKHLYLLVFTHSTGITETPVTHGYLLWLQAHGFNVPPDWKAGQTGLQEAKAA